MADTDAAGASVIPIESSTLDNTAATATVVDRATSMGPPAPNPKKGAKKVRKCQYCDKEFHKACVLEAHERTHTGERPFKCDACGKKFSRQSHLTRHLATSHTPMSQRPVFKCDKCNAVFHSADHLSRHKSKACVRTQCPHCNFTASSGWHLNKHIEAKHRSNHADSTNNNSSSSGTTGAGKKASRKPVSAFVCYEGCDEVFQSREERRKHIAEAHGYQCPKCAQRFASSRRRRDHLKANHAPCFRCPEKDCSSVFTTRYNLQQHIQSQHQNRRLQCPLCSETFACQSTLARHRRSIHTNDALKKELSRFEEEEQGEWDLFEAEAPAKKRGRYTKALFNRILGVCSVEGDRIALPRVSSQTVANPPESPPNTPT